jgi:hypothetical protein
VDATSWSAGMLTPNKQWVDTTGTAPPMGQA